MNEQKILIDLGNDIRNLRKEAGISQEGLAKKAGIERTQLTSIENGQIMGVQFLTIQKIYNSLGLKLKGVLDKLLVLHPFVKWDGGKTQLLNEIVKRLPKKYDTYFEPFVGGGALLFKLQPEKFVINDINKELMVTFECFKNKKTLNNLINTLKEHEKNHSEDYFLQIRKMDQESDFLNLPKHIIAARFIYLNKSCFNGMYRVNSKGFFNVPSGKKKKVNAFEHQNFANLATYFNTSKGIICCKNYEESLETVKQGDFVYFDPPYDILKNKNSFGKEGQIQLAKVFKEMDKKVFM
ncbi:adenine-specific DNA methyltransferase [Mycoplasmopsis californica]|uniref:Site-specific DNA-methyltransferase (adenine-specific) n=1 Tax=Mycoplasmopsis equigenitalium TaxID=114883 RepID=A0ABY5J195_9BACT|nr:Dam family site-specific DNA-(adenine-N6)-methyltransferase [Mycoplasmopsis equigenitalium]UUD37025.1 Dam family site-specific DNA-(adenine-N6)-methyltransferase [Mycoplasmopsis equigenitalium]VEU69676.1 adenine-specific DNA methyltransferase [Mycoplasmopsis californica]